MSGDFSDNRKGRGISLSLETLLELRKRLSVLWGRAGTRQVWLKVELEKVADELGIDSRTVKRYYSDQDCFQKVVLRETRKAEMETSWRIFFEGMRLLSTSLIDVCDTMALYVPSIMHQGQPTPVHRRKPQRNTSDKVCFYKALQCFDAENPVRPVRERMTDTVLRTHVSENLKDWPPGTVGVHRVAVEWHIDHSETRSDRSRPIETGGIFPGLLFAERRDGLGKEIAFCRLDRNESAEHIADKIKEFLADIDAPSKVVRLVVGKVGSSFAPTAISKEALQPLLEGIAVVEEDVPTQGLCGDYFLTDDKPSVFRLKGRFKSADEVDAYLWLLLVQGFSAYRKGRVRRETG